MITLEINPESNPESTLVITLESPLESTLESTQRRENMSERSHFPKRAISIFNAILEGLKCVELKKDVSPDCG